MAVLDVLSFANALGARIHEPPTWNVVLVGPSSQVRTGSGLLLAPQPRPALADLVARYLVVDERPSQSAYAIPSALASSDPTVAAFERWIREHLDEPVTMADAC